MNEVVETFNDRIVDLVAEIGLPSNFQVKIGVDALPDVTEEEVSEACRGYFDAAEGRIAYRGNMRKALEAARKVQPPRYYFQIRCWREDAITPGVFDWGYGGKAYLSPHASNNELVQIIFGLYKGYNEHEARETFQWRGRRVFGPHIRTDALWDVARKVELRSAMHVDDKEEN